MEKCLLKVWIVCLAAAIIILFGCEKAPKVESYLIRVGSRTISVSQFQQAVEATSEEAFPGEHDISSSSLKDLRIRVLNQLSDELIILERAKQMDLSISSQELKDAVAALKADYPDDTFEKTLLENAISVQAWKKKLAKRLLIDKVIEKELVDKVEITSKDVAIYFQNHYPKGIPKGEDAAQINKRIVQHLRQQKAEALYHGWIESLRKKFPVEINQQQWNRLVEKEANKHERGLQ